MPADAEFVADLLGPSIVAGVGLAATFVVAAVVLAAVVGGGSLPAKGESQAVKDSAAPLA